MSKPGCVYELIDPRTDETRYIGATVHPDKRLEQHKKDPVNPDLGAWLDELEASGLEPELNVLKRVSRDSLGDEEMAVIQSKAESCDLLNTEKGPKWSPRNDPPERLVGQRNSATTTVKMDGNGRVTIPARIRETLGVKGEEAYPEVEVRIDD